MTMPQGNLPEDATIIDTRHLRLLNEIADLAEKVQDGKRFDGQGYEKGPTPKQLLAQRLLDLRIIQTR